MLDRAILNKLFASSNVCFIWESSGFPTTSGPLIGIGEALGDGCTLTSGGEKRSKAFTLTPDFVF